MAQAQITLDQMQLDVGISLSAIYQRNSGLENTPVKSNTAYRSGLSFTASRSVNSKWDVGTGVEMLFASTSNEKSFGSVVVWKMLEGRYHASRVLSLTSYFSLGRFARENPAYGYGVGGGMSYKLNADWQLNINANYLGTDASIDTATTSKRDKFLWLNVGASYRF